MKRISILALILGACFASAWAQQDAGKPRSGKHPLLRHRIVNGMAKAPGAAAAANLKTWDLGHYPGGTWAQLGDINDFGVAVGIGDVLDGFTHTLSVPVFGPHAGKWTDLGTLGGTSSGGGGWRAGQPHLKHRVNRGSLRHCGGPCARLRMDREVRNGRSGDARGHRLSGL